jgi:hypothetical protein
MLILEADDTAVIRAPDFRLLRAAGDVADKTIVITLADLDEMGLLIEYANPAFTLMNPLRSARSAKPLAAVFAEKNL